MDNNQPNNQPTSPVKTVSIIDSGVANLGSATRAFEHLGVNVEIVTTPEQIVKATHLILPGVGAFEDGMNGLRSRGLIEPIREYAKSGRPLFGICLGMQMLFTKSEEFGEWDGLDLIPGRVVRMKAVSDVNIPGYKVPLIGWNSITLPEGKTWEGTFLQTTKQGSGVYFVHSFFAKPDNPDHVLAVEEYFGQIMCAVAKKDNVMGTQFHPEKSGSVGIAMLKAFVDLP